MINRAAAISLLPAPKMQKSIVAPGYHTTEQIIRDILKADNQCAGQTRALAAQLMGSTIKDTCHNIYKFIKENIKYKADPDFKQLVREPARAMHDGVSDCKSMSLFYGTLLKNLGIPYAYRFVSYDKTNPQPTHVYCIAYDGINQIVCDAVHPFFNTQNKYTSKQDYKMLARLSGIDTQGVGSLYSDVKDFLDKKSVSNKAEAERIIKLIQQALTDTYCLALFGEKKLKEVLNHYQKELQKFATATADKLTSTTSFAFDQLKNTALGKTLWAKVEPLFAKGLGSLFLYNFVAENALPEKARKKRQYMENFMGFMDKYLGLNRALWMDAAKRGTKILYGHDNPTKLLPAKFQAYLTYYNNGGKSTYETWLKAKPSASGDGGKAQGGSNQAGAMKGIGIVGGDDAAIVSIILTILPIIIKIFGAVVTVFIAKYGTPNPPKPNEDGLGGGDNDPPKYGTDGYDQYGYDKDGYNKQGYDKDGYDKDGYDKNKNKKNTGGNNNSDDEHKNKFNLASPGLLIGLALIGGLLFMGKSSK